jgi:FMN phosphatase YigB (HAD superfamily)
MITSDNIAAANTAGQKSKLRSAELLSAFEAYAPHIKVLSLDCFDTLIWRQTAEPRDVFYDLENRPAFKALDISALTRINAETFSYSMNKLKIGTRQTNLKEIYQSGFPELNEDKLRALAEEELAAELDTCFAFPPIIELIRRAHTRGIKVIIVSDTYLQEYQLRRLLAHALPADVLACIDKIYCSCDMRKGKSEGLFIDIINELQAPAASILHIGDNVIADYAAPKALGVRTLHFVHHEETTAELLRMQAVIACFIDPSIRNRRPLLSPFKSLLAHRLTNATPESIIGYASLGPIMYGFARFICSEVERLKQAGKRPKILFLMRDAHLPALACEALTGEKIGIRVRISRFAAYASSFRSEADVDVYLSNRIKSKRFDDLCRQLLLPQKLSDQIIQQIRQAQNPNEEFTRLVHKKDVLDTIYKQSSIYRKRLFRHLQKEVGLESGDTLLFVDLGYSGTAQNRLDPVFRDEAGVDTFGCYLIALRTPNWKATRRGLLDAASYDDRALSMFTSHIALFEQLCTETEKSVVDYDEDGNPVFSDVELSDNQYKKLKPVHQECIRFIHDAKDYFKSLKLELTQDVLRDVAAFNLCRLTYLPTRMELEYLKAFQIDFNVGTNEVLPIFDLEKGLTSLKRRTWLYSAKEHLRNMRLNYPSEWRAANLELAITLIAQLRFGLEVAPNDLTHRTESIQVIAVQNEQASPLTLTATQTFDGYYSLMVPVVAGNFKAGIQFGLNYEWIEIESAELIPHLAIYSNVESDNTLDASPYLAGELMTAKNGGLYECLSENSFIIFNRPQSLGKDNYVLRVIFRPIVWRNKPQSRAS